jgi:N-acetylglucosamine kinase-like BadF-type ATPase
MERSNSVLGIEGGGTKTEWVLLTGGEVAEQGMLPAANLKLLPDDALARLFSVLPGEVGRVGAFLAGCATDGRPAAPPRLGAGSAGRRRRSPSAVIVSRRWRPASDLMMASR